MPETPLAKVQRQVARAGRRLFVQTLLNNLVWCWAAALLLAVAWFLVQPLLFANAEEWLRWTVAGGVFAVATGVAVWLGWRQAPGTVAAALEFDQRFQLKERATASLTLSPELRQSPAGQALTADAAEQADKVNVRQAFPVRLSWTALLVPACAGILALVAIFYDPVFDDNQRAAAKEEKVPNAMQIAEAVEKLKAPLAKEWSQEEKSKQLDEIEKMLANMTKFDPTEKDKLREQLQKMVSLEEKLRDRIDDLKMKQDRNKAMQDLLREMGKDPERKLAPEGPAKDLENALNKGDLNEVQKALQDLADKLKDNKLTDEQRKALEKQLGDIQQKLQNLAELNNLDPDALNDLKELSDQIGECKEDLGDNPLEAARKLVRIVKGLGECDGECKELQLLEDRELLLRQAKAAMQQGLGVGERPISPDGETGSKTARQNAELNSKTQFRITGDQKGGTFTKIPASQVGGEFRQRQQDAADAIERQQVRPEDAPVVRGYFENLGGGQKK